MDYFLNNLQKEYIVYVYKDKIILSANEYMDRQISDYKLQTELPYSVVYSYFCMRNLSSCNLARSTTHMIKFLAYYK